MIDLALIEQCSPEVHPATMMALIKSESSANPYAIGVVGMNLTSQPTTLEEARETASHLIKEGYNISLGLGQINIHNFDWLRLDLNSVFDKCANLEAAQTVLKTCYDRATSELSGDDALKAALSCYYSNNFQRGFEPDDRNGFSYIDRYIINRTRVPSTYDSSLTYNVPDLISKGGVNIDENKRVINDVKALEDLTPDVDRPSWDVFKELI